MPSHPSRTATVAVLAVLALTASACGGDDDGKAKPKPAQTSLTGPGVKPSENFATGEAFFEAVAAGTPATLAEAAKLAAPGSDAARYVANLLRQVTSGEDISGGTSEKRGTGTYRLCAPGGAVCLTADGVQLADGKVSSFRLDGKRLGSTPK